MSGSLTNQTPAASSEVSITAQKIISARNVLSMAGLRAAVQIQAMANGNGQKNDIHSPAGQLDGS